MINRKGTTVYNKGKKIKTFEEEDDAESFANALSMMENNETNKVVEQKTNKLFTSINEFKQHLLSEGKEFEYMLLSRLQMDCKYFLGNGNGNERNLWADNVNDHIEKMKELYNSVDPKPEWISMEDIEDFEIKMNDKLEEVQNESKHLVTESNITQDDLDYINETLPDEKTVNRFFISYYTDNIGGKPVIVIDVSGKRGRPSDAYLMALRTNKPKLPSGYKYVSGKAIDYNGEPVTADSIKKDDEYYDDRGYTDSEFDGAVLYEIEKTEN